MWALLRRDIKLALRSGGGASSALLFYFVIVVAMPFAVGPNTKLLATIGPAVLWIGALLAALLGLERVLQVDREDGSLDVMMGSQSPLAAIIFIKCLAHWLVTGLPLTLAAPLFGLFLTVPTEAAMATFATLLIGTPALSFIGVVGAAVTVGLPRGGMLLSILVLPLCIPVLIFGVGAVRAASHEIDPFLPPFLLLAALTLFFAVIGPLAAAAALRLGRN